jgi:DNA-binding transcriptional LysR family regulator
MIESSTTLAGLDLNLLVYLQALLEARNVTRAGESLSVSQPAVSQALGRLRRHFDDPLLVRSGRGYELTPLARSLHDDVTLTCGLAARVFAARATYDPTVAEREFTLLATDQAVAVLGRPLSRALATVGSGVRFQLRHIGVGDIARLDDVMRGVDGFIAPHAIMSGYPNVDLYSDEWVTVADRGNAMLGDRPQLDLAALAALRWVVAYHNPPRDVAIIVRELQAHQIDPIVDVVLDSFQSIPFFVADTDRIACLPARLARGLAPLADLVTRPLPFPTAPLAEALWWHPTRDRDPGHIWMRTMMRGLVTAG